MVIIVTNFTLLCTQTHERCETIIFVSSTFKAAHCLRLIKYILHLNKERHPTLLTSVYREYDSSYVGLGAGLRTSQILNSYSTSQDHIML